MTGMSGGTRPAAVELLAWIVAAISCIALLACVLLALWSALAPSNGDSTGMVFGFAVFLGTGAFVLGGLCGLAGLVMRSNRLRSVPARRA
jgi:hypothetical protein